MSDKIRRVQPFKNLPRKSARKFKRSTQEKMLKGVHSGRLYKKKRGSGFTRSHLASAIGQRPAPDTLTLVNAISDRSLGDYKAEVYIAERINPESGTLASNYGEILQNKLDRPIMSADDADEAERDMTRDAEALIKTVI
jgi:hypothetical protein